jgi:hypothetical protein
VRTCARCGRPIGYINQLIMPSPRRSRSSPCRQSNARTLPRGRHESFGAWPAKPAFDQAFETLGNHGTTVQGTPRGPRMQPALMSTSPTGRTHGRTDQRRDVQISPIVDGTLVIAVVTGTVDVFMYPKGYSLESVVRALAADVASSDSEDLLQTGTIRLTLRAILSSLWGDAQGWNKLARFGSSLLDRV